MKGRKRSIGKSLTSGAASVAAFTLVSVAAWAASPPPKNPATCINQYHGKCKATPPPKHCRLDSRPVACKHAGGGETATKPKPAPTVPPVPAGWQVAAAAQGTDSVSADADASVFEIKNPVLIDVRFTGNKFVGAIVVIVCDNGATLLGPSTLNYSRVGLYGIPVPAGAVSCSVDADGSGTGTVTSQILTQGGTVIATDPSAPPTTPTTTSPTPTPTDTVSPTTISLGSAGGCTGGNLTATIQIAARSNVSWTVKADPNSNAIGQVVAGSGNGSGSFTLTIHVGPQTPTFDCGHTVPMSESTLVDVTFSNGTIRGVTVYWTYIFVE